MGPRGVGLDYNYKLRRAITLSIFCLHIFTQHVNILFIDIYNYTEVYEKSITAISDDIYNKYVYSERGRYFSLKSV